MTSGQRKRFEKMYGSVFFSHTATQSIINAEKPLALIRAGIVEIIIQFMVARGIVLTETFRLDDSAGEDNTAPRAVPYSTGNIWIDQETHQAMQQRGDGRARPTASIYAVGAMVRGRILDASMAGSVVRSISKEAVRLFETAGFP